MDRLEPVVSECELDEQRQVVLMEEPLQVGERSTHLLRRRSVVDTGLGGEPGVRRRWDAWAC